jgi:hypothetical protein
MAGSNEGWERSSGVIGLKQTHTSGKALLPPLSSAAFPVIIIISNVSIKIRPFGFSCHQRIVFPQRNPLVLVHPSMPELNFKDESDLIVPNGQ